MDVDIARLRRRLRRAGRVGKWSTHTKIAVAVWLPVAVVALAFYTGPNRSSNASTPTAIVTTTTVAAAPPTLPDPPPITVPDDAMLVGALPEITPRMPRGITDQLRVRMKQISRGRLAANRNTIAVLREWTRTNAAKARTEIPETRSKTLEDRVKNKLVRRTLR